jgi:hypothetical protein
LLKLAAAKKEAGNAYGLLVIHMPTKDQPVIRNVSFRAQPQEIAAGRRDGSYLLRSNLESDDPGHLRRLYSQLVKVEKVFKDLKNDLAVRPIYHQLETRIEAHIFIAISGLLPAGYAETSAEGAGARIDRKGQARMKPISNYGSKATTRRSREVASRPLVLWEICSV